MIYRFVGAPWTAVVALLLGLLASGGAAGAQSSGASFFAAPEVRDSEVLARGGYAVVIDLDENELHFVHGRTVLWTAPVGTGMGLRLQDGDRGWRFSTPTGVYHVQAKEENPTWYAPDWFFIENKRPVPPPNDPRRRFPGSLGAAAVYIGRGLAIHGTDKPDLLGQRVSHGCIRLANEFAQRLYHNVTIGTEVIIVGDAGDELGELIPGQVPGAGPVDARTERFRQQAKAERDRLLREVGRSSFEALAERLRNGLDTADDAEWVVVTNELLRRALREDDEEAARLLFASVPERGPRRIRSEYGTFVADLAARRGMLTTRALSQLPEPSRSRAARAIVSATVDLFGMERLASGPPWPTRRIPASLMDDDSRPGWEALAAAERWARDRHEPIERGRRGGR